MGERLFDLTESNLPSWLPVWIDEVGIITGKGNIVVPKRWIGTLAVIGKEGYMSVGNANASLFGSAKTYELEHLELGSRVYFPVETVESFAELLLDQGSGKSRLIADKPELTKRDKMAVGKERRLFAELSRLHNLDVCQTLDKNLLDYLNELGSRNDRFVLRKISGKLSELGIESADLRVAIKKLGIRTPFLSGWDGYTIDIGDLELAVLSVVDSK